MTVHISISAIVDGMPAVALLNPERLNWIPLDIRDTPMPNRVPSELLDLTISTKAGSFRHIPSFGRPPFWARVKAVFSRGES